MIFTTPQPPPFAVGDRVKYCGTLKSAGQNSEGEWVWSHYPGAMYTCIAVHSQCGYSRDPDTGERYPLHGWSELRSDDDTEGCHTKAIDAETALEYGWVAS